MSVAAKNWVKIAAEWSLSVVSLSLLHEDLRTVLALKGSLRLRVGGVTSPQRERGLPPENSLSTFCAFHGTKHFEARAPASQADVATSSSIPVR